MKKYASLLITTLILVSGAITGCSSSKSSEVAGGNALVDCLNKTKSVNSMEMNITTSTKVNGKAMEITMNMQAEDIQKDMKSKVEMDMLGKKQEFYLSKSNGSIKMYAKDATGKYTATSVDSSQVSGTDTAKSFDSYAEVIEKNPSMMKKISDNTYELDVPKEQAQEIYSKVSTQKMPQSLEGFKVDFVIGDDGYLKNVDIKMSIAGTETEAKTEYLNYNKKFGITIPEVSK